MMVIPLQVRLTPFTILYIQVYTMQKQQTQLIGILISGEGDCGEGDCGEGDCGEGDCGEGDCGEGEWIPLKNTVV